MNCSDPNEPEKLAHHLTDVGHLGSAVGHHVINAFTSIVSNVEMLRLRTLPLPVAELSQLINEIVNTSVEASGVARRLIDYTRALTTPYLKRVELDHLIMQFADNRRLHLQPHIHLLTDFQAVDLVIDAQPSHLHDMLDYLVTNSIESRVKEKMVITLRTVIDQRGWAVLEVADDGPGMSEAFLKQAVEPFFTTKPGHAGVGLSISNGIWRRHRGTTSIQSKPGEGTTIRLCVEPRKLTGVVAR